MFPITVINLAAGVTDIYHLSSQYPWFRIVPKTDLDFVQFPCTRWETGMLRERERLGKEPAAEMVPVCGCKLSTGASSGLLNFATTVSEWDCSLHCANWKADQRDQRTLKKNKCIDCCVAQNISWLTFSLFEDLLIEKCRMLSFRLVFLTLRFPTVVILFFSTFHSQLYRYKHF